MPIVTLLLLAALAPPRPQPAAQVPDFKVQIWGDAAADFTARMSAYEALRHKLEEGLPRLEVTANPLEIVRAENLLAARIRVPARGADPSSRDPSVARSGAR